MNLVFEIRKVGNWKDCFIKDPKASSFLQVWIELEEILLCRIFNNPKFIPVDIEDMSDKSEYKRMKENDPKMPRHYVK